MKKTASQQAWLRAHRKDGYAKQAKAEGHRSRARYKLLEIQARDHLIQRGDCVVDLGAAPGGWSEVAAQCTGSNVSAQSPNSSCRQPSGCVIAIDQYDMPPLPGVTFLRGDFMTEETQSTLISALERRSIDVVLSDMAPNTSGIKSLDQLRSMALAESALVFALSHLAPQGAFLVKVFQGIGSQEFLQTLRHKFIKVSIRKPKSSKPSSREVYMLGRKLRQEQSDYCSTPQP